MERINYKYMGYSSTTKNKAIQLRRNGYSINKIANKLSIAKSTVSTWTKKIKLTAQTQQKLINNSKIGLLKAQKKLLEQRKTKLREINKEAILQIQGINTNNKQLCKLIASIIYCKSNSGPRKRQGYQGCISIRYNDSNVAKKLSSIYDAFAQQIGP